MSARLKGWQDPSEHSPQSGKPVLFFVEDKETSRRYQTTGIYFANEIPASDIDYIELFPNPDEDQEEIKPGYYHLIEIECYMQSIESVGTALLYWSYLPENPILI